MPGSNHTENIVKKDNKRISWCYVDCSLLDQLWASSTLSTQVNLTFMWQCIV